MNLPNDHPLFPIMNTSASAPYLLLFRNTGPETHAHLSPEERQQLVLRWNAWYEGLRAQGKAVAGHDARHQLERAGRA
jgi:hypothetical protein